MLKHLFAPLACALAFVACDDDPSPAPAGTSANGDAGSSGSSSSSGASGAASSCTVAYSCRTTSGALTLNCIDSSAKPDGAKDACEGQSVGGLTYVYSESPCPRDGAAAGCEVRKGSDCTVAWLYSSGGGASAAGVDTFASQCRAQGHEPVVP